MNTNIIFAAFLMALANSVATLSENAERFPKLAGGLGPYQQIVALRAQNQALLAENNTLKGQNDQLQSKINDYIAGIKEITRRLSNRYDQGAASPLLGKGATNSDLSTEIAELKDLDASLTIRESSEPTPLAARSILRDLVEKIIRIINDLINILIN